jgi:hypothetical protein
VTVWILFSVRTCINIAMLYLFMKLFIFFFSLKKLKMSRENQQFKSYQIFCTLLIVFLAILNGVESILRGLAPLEMYKDSLFFNNDSYSAYRDSCMIAYSVIDCLTSFGILTLFYFVGKDAVVGE